MSVYDISRSFGWDETITEKVGQVMRMFGLTAEGMNRSALVHRCRLKIRDGDIVYITGPSGCGKTVVLGELEKAIDPAERINLESIELPREKSVIDCVDGEFVSALRVLSIAGINDVFSVLNSPANLSEGQKYRFRLAMAIASKKKFIFADEFCTNLDRITASVIAYNIRKHASGGGPTFILASSHQDILADLSADVLVSKDLSGQTEVVYKGSNCFL